jgi:hypothetical protein
VDPVVRAADVDGRGGGRSPGLIDSGIELENNQIDALVGVGESLLPSGAGPWRLTIRDQAGEEIDGGLGYDSIKGLAALADSLLPRHPG